MVQGALAPSHLPEPGQLGSLQAEKMSYLWE